MNRTLRTLIVASLAVLTLGAGPTEPFDRWLASTVLGLTYHVPTQHVWIHVDRLQWDARMVQAADTKERDLAVRRSVCFGIWDVAANKWEWPPEKSSYEVYSLIGGTKTVLAKGSVLNCTTAEAGELWTTPTPSHPAKHHYF